MEMTNGGAEIRHKGAAFFASRARDGRELAFMKFTR
jgi:hypothetical protein